MENPLNEDVMELLTEETQQFVKENPEAADELVTLSLMVGYEQFVKTAEQEFSVTEQELEHLNVKDGVSVSDIRQVVE